MFSTGGGVIVQALSVHSKITIAPYFWETGSRRELFVWMAPGSKTLNYRMRFINDQGIWWFSVRSVVLTDNLPWQAYIRSQYNYIVDWRSLI